MTLQGGQKEVTTPTWCIVYNAGVLLGLIQYNHWIYTNNDYFGNSNKNAVLNKISALGLNTTDWDNSQA